LPMIMILFSDATVLLVPSHHDVAQDVLREADGALELARLRGRQRELDDAVLAVAVVGDLVGETALRVGRGLLDLPAEAVDGLLEPPADRAKALLVGGGRAEIHELVRSHSLSGPFHGLAAGLRPGAKRRRGR